MKNFSVFCLLVLISYACSNAEKPVVSGTISNAEGEKISLITYPNNQPDTLASALLNEKGDFSFDVPSTAFEFYSLEVNPQKRIVLAFDSTENPVVTADFSNMDKDYQVKGSPDSERIRDFFVEGGAYEANLDTLMREIKSYSNQAVNPRRDTLVKEYNDLRMKYREYLEDFIKKDSSSVANLSLIRKFDPIEDIEYYRMVKNGLKDKLAGSVYLMQISDQILRAENELKKRNFLKPGTEAPDITLNNPEGQPVSLSSLRGQYVLIDFWASWCKPCRIENPNVVKVYNKYKDDGFEIYGVSLDQDKNRWVNAIKQDGLEWLQVSDLRSWNSIAGKLYNVTSIPFTVLLDKEGKVIQTNLRGAALEAKLADIFGH